MRRHGRAAQSVSGVWARHHRRMHYDDEYSRAVIQALVAAAWQQDLAQVGKIIARTTIEVARSRIHRR